MDWGRLTTYLQVAGAALGIPAAAGGAYTVYQNYFTNDVICQKLRTTIVSTMERNVAPDAKRTLLRKDVTEFSKSCANFDPDAKVLFEAALADHKFAAAPAEVHPVAPANAVASAVPTAPNGPARTADGIPVWVVNSFGRSPTGEARGWVALTRGEANRMGEPNFDGHELSQTVVPPSGTILRARQVMPVWMEPQGTSNDPGKLQGRVPGNACVRVISAKLAEGRGRNWGEVAPVQCPPALRAGGGGPQQNPSRNPPG